MRSVQALASSNNRVSAGDFQDDTPVQVNIAEHASPRGIHLVDVVVLRVLVAELVLQYLLGGTLCLAQLSDMQLEDCSPEPMNWRGQGIACTGCFKGFTFKRILKKCPDRWYETIGRGTFG